MLNRIMLNFTSIMASPLTVSLHHNYVNDGIIIATWFVAPGFRFENTNLVHRYLVSNQIYIQ